MSHVQNEHGSHPNCPFCQIGFTNLTVLRKHIYTMHTEQSPHNARASVIVQNNISTRRIKQKQCIFFLQPRGCKKGSSCDFSHNINNQQPRITKVRIVFYNGPTCTWKPGCKYVHLEDFLAPNVSQPPPGYNSSFSSMKEFPGLPQIRRPSVFQQNLQFQ